MSYLPYIIAFAFAALVAALWRLSLTNKALKVRLEAQGVALAVAQRRAQDADAKALHLENALLQKLNLPPVGADIPAQYDTKQKAAENAARRQARLRALGHTNGLDPFADGEAETLLNMENQP